MLADARKAWANREETLTPAITRELERRVVLSVLDRKWREHLYEMDYLKEGIGLRAMAQRDPLVEYQREGFDMFAAMLDSLKEESVGFLYNLQVQVVPAGEPAAPAAVHRRLPRRSPPRRRAATALSNGGSNGGRGCGSARTADGSGCGARGRPGSAPGASGGGAADPAGGRRGAPSPTTTGGPAALRGKGLGGPADRGAADLQRSARGRRHRDPAFRWCGAASGQGAATATGSKEPARNAPCPCGSGKKYKLCHGRPGAN